MGLFKRERRVVFKPASQVDLSPASTEVYLRADVKGWFIPAV